MTKHNFFNTSTLVTSMKNQVSIHMGFTSTPKYMKMDKVMIQYGAPRGLSLSSQCHEPLFKPPWFQDLGDYHCLITKVRPIVLLGFCQSIICHLHHPHFLPLPRWWALSNFHNSQWMCAFLMFNWLTFPRLLRRTLEKTTCSRSWINSPLIIFISLRWHPQFYFLLAINPYPSPLPKIWRVFH